MPPLSQTFGSQCLTSSLSQSWSSPRPQTGRQEDGHCLESREGGHDTLAITLLGSQARPTRAPGHVALQCCLLSPPGSAPPSPSCPHALHLRPLSHRASSSPPQPTPWTSHHPHALTRAPPIPKLCSKTLPTPPSLPPKSVHHLLILLSLPHCLHL